MVQQNMKKSLRRELKSKQKGIDLFIKNWLKTDEILSKKEFMAHGYCESFYYITKKKFEQWKEDFLKDVDDYEFYFEEKEN